MSRSNDERGARALMGARLRLVRSPRRRRQLVKCAGVANRRNGALITTARCAGRRGAGRAGRMPASRRMRLIRATKNGGRAEAHSRSAPGHGRTRAPQTPRCAVIIHFRPWMVFRIMTHRAECRECDQASLSRRLASGDVVLSTDDEEAVGHPSRASIRFIC